MNCFVPNPRIQILHALIVHSHGVHNALIAQAMKDVSLDAATVDVLQVIVAAVLHIGQVTFTPNGDACTASNLAALAGLLAIDEPALQKALTVRVVAARGEVFETKLAADRAEYARDALAKAVYDRLFSHLVAKINERIVAKKEGTAKTITMGVLDIYGFEIFPSNG